MRITLIRHAKSSWKDPSRADFERPLNARGRRDAPRMAEFLAGRLSAPDWLAASDALRTRATAAELVRAFGLPEERVVYDHRIYGADVATLLDVVRETPADVGHLALVGHNPGVADLVRALDPHAELDNVPTMGVVDIELDTRDWLEVRGGCGHVVNVFVPRKLPG